MEKDPAVDSVVGSASLVPKNKEASSEDLMFLLVGLSGVLIVLRAG